LLLHKPDERPVIADEEYQGGLNASLENAQASLVEGYEKATITTRRKSDRFELVLWAMALADTKDVQVQDIAKNSGFFTSEEAPKASSFSSTLGELSKETRGCILTKVRDGYYKFTDPLMRPYVRCLLESERLLTPGQQWEFPFMLSG
jgi:hypothetical protein